MRTTFFAISIAGAITALGSTARAQASPPQGAAVEPAVPASPPPAAAEPAAPASPSPAAEPATPTPPPEAAAPSASPETAKPIPDPYADVDINIVHTDKLTLDIGGMAQVLGLAQSVDDPSTAQIREYLFMPHARLRIDGSYDRYSFNLQLALGGEDSVNGTSGIDFSLLDMAFNVPLTASGTTYLKVGQFLVPYGREQLTDPGFQDFADVSMEGQSFVVGRDVGIAIVSKPGPMTLIGGVFTGGGRDIPPDHYLPERLGVPELVARAGIGDLDADPFYLRASDPDPDQTRYQISVSGLYMRDSTIGHSTVLNVKSLDKSLLIDSNWNPFIAAGGVGGFSQGDYWQAEADAAIRSPMGNKWAFAGEAQFDYGGYSNGYGTLSMWGARAQTGFIRDPFEVELRYDVLAPSNQFAYQGVAITGSEPIHEITPGASWYIWGTRLKAILDFPILINTPVFTEPHVGDYVGTELPDQSTVLAKATGGSVARQTVPQARLMFQAQF
jgi:hypothetical protein